MTVRQTLLAACLGFVVIICMLGLLARHQMDQLGRLELAMYDHSFVGITYVDQAQAQFLLLPDADDAAGPDRLRNVLDRLDVAIERAGAGHTRDAARHVRTLVAALPGLPAAQRGAQRAQIRHALEKLVQTYAADGLKARDEAEMLLSQSGHVLLGEVAVALALAVGLAFLLGQLLSPPLIALVRSISLLTAGELAHEIPASLLRRGDEIGAVARATSFFREAMLRHVAAGVERARLEADSEAARQNAERIEASIAAKSDFLAAMSHEIRTPMNGVATIANLLADTALTPDQAKMVSIIRQSAGWLIRVINDILDFSKLEAQQLHIESVPFMLEAVVEAACEVLAAKAREKNLDLRVEGQDLADVCRIGDPLRVRQIVLNLAGNAVKFTARGSVTVRLHAQPDQCSVSVIDTGIGIPEDKIGSLFQPYNQLRSDAARSYGGTGLGLSITKSLIEQMGGTLEVASVNGEGSCFTVRLPLPTGDAALCKPASAPEGSDVAWQAPPAEIAAAHCAVVLCAEDNLINRDVLGRVLDRLGIAYDMAEDGAAALALLDRGRHAAVLTDGQMPVLDGWQLATSIRQSEAASGWPRLPVIMLTANALSETGRRSIDAGIDTVLTKPLNLALLESGLMAAAPQLGRLRVPAQAPRPGAVAPPPPAQEAGAIQLGVLRELIGDDRDTLRALLDDFCVSVTAQHAQLRDALAAADLRRAATHAHAMKGAARTAGAARIAELCHGIETRVQSEAVADEMAALERAIVQLPADIDTVLKTVLF